MNWPWIAAAFVITFGAMLGANRWVATRWRAGGMTPTRAAVLVTAATFVPAIAIVVVGSWISGRDPKPETWPLLLGVMALAALPSFGLTRAMFQYREQTEARKHFRKDRK